MRSIQPLRRATRGFVTAMLVVHAVLLLDMMRKNFVVMDEVGHFPAGLSHWQTGTFTMYCVNPPLPRMLSVLPVLAARPVSDYSRLTHTPGMRPEWTVGVDFLAANKDRYFDLTCLARLSGIAWSLLGAYLIFRWSRELYGETGGCLAMALWCFNPTVLAFAPLVLPDVPAAVAGLAATYLFWHYLKQPSWPRAGWSGVLLGVALLTKFTLLVLYVAWPLIWLFHRPNLISVQPQRRLAFHALGAIILSVLVINLGYGFVGTCRNLGSFAFVSKTFAGEAPDGRGEFTNGLSGNRFRSTLLGEVPVPLPSDFLNGIDIQRRDFEHGFPSYLAGEWRNHGWWYYYIYALAVKFPIGTLALIVATLVLVCLTPRRSERWADEMTLLIPSGLILVFVSSQTGFNHHLRYILPAMPFLIVATGTLARFFRVERWRAGVSIATLLAWSFISVLVIHPHEMSYFNEAAGGPTRGDEHLLDSNIDWGQDLFYLKQWLDDHPEAEPLGLAYFNNRVDPRIVGIEYHLPPSGPSGIFENDHNYQSMFGPQPGYFAVSVNFLRGLGYPAPDGAGRWRFVKEDYDYFRHFKPIAQIGYSIRIYHITKAKANVVRRRLGLPQLSEE